MKTILADRLCQLRKEKQLRQEDVAAALGIATLTYQRYEYGQREPLASVLRALADFFDVSTDYLVGRTDEL